jgi:hypothetical protein
MRSLRRGALAVLILCLASAGPASGQAYPRLGQYLSTTGQGMPLVRGDGTVDSELLSAVSKHHTVVLSATPFTEYRPDVLLNLKALHPSMVLLAYTQPQYVYPHAAADSNVNIPTRLRRLVRDLNGYLYDKTGEEFRNANVNLAKKQGNKFVVAEALADFYWVNILQGRQWSGMFLDRFCSSILWDQEPGDSIDFVRAGYPNAAAFDAAWLVATDTLANRLRRISSSSTILVGNCATSTKYSAMNGWMRENFPMQLGGTWDSNMNRDPGGYFIDDQRYRSPRYNWLTAWNDPAQDPYAPENMRRARMALATAALGEGLGVFNPPDLDWQTNYWKWWYDEYGVCLPSGVSSDALACTGWLGQPLGPRWNQFWVGAGEDGIANPGFDADLSAWTFTSTAGGSWSRDTMNPPVGSASLRCTVPSAGTGPSSTRLRSTSTLFYLPPLAHNVTFWARSTTTRTIELAAVSIANPIDFAVSTIAIDATWKQYRVTWTTGQGFGPAMLELRVGGSAANVWFDDVHFQRDASSIYRRDFQNGIVLVNPAEIPLTVPLEAPFKRIFGKVDAATNSGAWTTSAVVNPNDALFLIRQSASPVGVAPQPGGDGGLADGSGLWREVAPNPAFGPVRALLSAERGAGPVEVDVLDVRGRRVVSLLRAERAEAAATLVWDGRDDAGRRVPAGVYWLRARVGPRVDTKKILRLSARDAH